MSLARSTLLVAAASVASRVLGFARDVLFAGVLGAGPVADAFLAAYRLPNALRRVLGEGGLNPALIPALARMPAEDRPRFAGEAFSALAVALLALTVLVEVLAVPALLVLAPGLGEEAGAVTLGALFTRLAFPLVIGVTLASFLAAILNHERRFVAAALAPLAVNLTLIAVLLGIEFATALSNEERALWLAAAVSLSGLLQLGLMGLALAWNGTPMRWARPRWSPDLRGLVAGAGPALLASGASQIFVLAGTQAASFLPSGLSWLYYADRVAQLPLGIVASAAGIVLLPELARHGEDGRGRVIAAQNAALGVAAVVALPAAMALACLSQPITAVLFERGAFTPEHTRGTAAALFGLSLSLPFAVAGKVLAQTLFARGAGRDALPPLLAGLLVTSLSAFLLGRVFGIVGVGIGVAFGCLAHAALLARALRGLACWAPDANLFRRLVRSGLASALLGAALMTARPLLPDTAVGLVLLCGGGFAVYAAAAWALGAVTRADMALLRKKP